MPVGALSWLHILWHLFHFTQYTYFYSPACLRYLVTLWDNRGAKCGITTLNRLLYKQNKWQLEPQIVTLQRRSNWWANQRNCSWLSGTGLPFLFLLCKNNKTFCYIWVLYFALITFVHKDKIFGSIINQTPG